ncbi:MAG: hypothetical protein RIQ84_1638 [Pseudomonadota bacterium]|jgi:hypothetical protein
MKKIKQILALGAVSISLGLSGLANAKPLITAKEAQLPAPTGELKTRGISRGPAIKVVSPDVGSGQINSPFDLKVQFEARGGNKIDPKSVKVTYLKSPNVDLTDRLKPTISESGINFEKAEVPEGEHAVRITVKDMEGRESHSIINLVIKK